MAPKFDGPGSEPLAFPEIRERCTICRGAGCLFCDAERAREKERRVALSAKPPEEIRASRRRIGAQRALPSAEDDTRIPMPDMRTLGGLADAVACQRCGRMCRVAGPRNEDARMLRRSREPKGYCANCAATEFLINTYPVNMLIEQSEHGPKMLLDEHVQQQFAAIMEAANADADPREIDWNELVRNWDLPFKNPPKPSATNPHVHGSARRDRAAAEGGPRVDRGLYGGRPVGMFSRGPAVFTSFEQINDVSPGLGDELRDALRPHPADEENGDANE